jgi:hypothetical protein
MVDLIHKIIVVLGLPKAVAALIIRMSAILEAMTANKATFPSPPIALATAQSHVAALSAAETATKTKALGTKQTRNDAQKLVIEDAKQLHAYVQQLANAHPDQASNIAAAAAMTLKSHGAHTQHDVTLKQGISGALTVHGKSLKGARSHEWQYTTDGGKSWTSLPVTTKSRTAVTGITPGTLVQVRHRIVVKTGPGDWVTSSAVAVS